MMEDISNDISIKLLHQFGFFFNLPPLPLNKRWQPFFFGRKILSMSSPKLHLLCRLTIHKNIIYVLHDCLILSKGYND